MIGYTCKECTTIIQKSVLGIHKEKRSRFQPMVIPTVRSPTAFEQTWGGALGAGGGRVGFAPLF